MCQRIEFFRITVSVLRRQLEAIQVFKIIGCLITIEMLEVGNINLPVIKKPTINFTHT